MKKSLLIFFSFTIILIHISCSSNSTGPEEIDDYMSLSVGDIREYYDADYDMYQIWEITGKTKRADSLDVFIGIYKSIYDTSNNYPSYYAIRDGYFVSTNLEKSTNLKNPFVEHRLAKLNPKDGDRWLQTEGVADSEKVYFSAEYVENYETPAAIFEDVIGFTLSDIPLTVYYSKYFGHLGSSMPIPNSIKISINYAKINGREVGEFVPLVQNKRLDKGNRNIKLRKVNILGQYIE